MKESSVNHRDIARLLGLNQATVSRALSNDKSHTVAAETRRRIEETARELGYRTDINARRISRKRSECLTFVVDNIDQQYSRRTGDMLFHSNNVFTEVLRGAICEAAIYNYDIKMLPISQDIAAPEDYIRERIGYPYSDGVIFYGMYYHNELRQWLDDNNFPCSVIQIFENGSSEPPFIINDHEPGYYRMFRYFREQGIKKVFYCNLRMFAPAERLYFERFCRVMADTAPEIEVEKYLIDGYYDFRMTSRILLDSVQNSGVPTALVCMTPMLSTLFMGEIKCRGMAQGEDILLAGVGEVTNIPELPVIRFQLVECGAAAVRQVLDRINSGKPSGDAITRIPGLFYKDDQLVP